jgi:hypothetical protein
MRQKLSLLAAVSGMAMVACTSLTEVATKLVAPGLVSETESGDILAGVPTVFRRTPVGDASRYALEMRRVDGRGMWVDSRFVHEAKARLVFREAGTYRVRARALDDSRRSGPWSNPIHIPVLGAGPVFVD